MILNLNSSFCSNICTQNVIHMVPSCFVFFSIYNKENPKFCFEIENSNRKKRWENRKVSYRSGFSETAQKFIHYHQKCPPRPRKLFPRLLLSSSTLSAGLSLCLNNSITGIDGYLETNHLIIIRIICLFIPKTFQQRQQFF